MSDAKPPKNPANFDTVSQADLPSGRRGKHHEILLKMVEDLAQLEPGRAIRIPLEEFAGSVADLRSAIHRAAEKRNMEIVTSSDEKFFYLWKPEI